MEERARHGRHSLTIKILIGMLLGIIVGVILKSLHLNEATFNFIVLDVLQTGGQIFLNLIKMLVVPVVFVSLVCGVGQLGEPRALGRIGGKSLLMYLLTTAIAVSCAIGLATLMHVGHNMHDLPKVAFSQLVAPSVTEVLINLFPTNPFQALVQGNMLQVIVFAILLGMAMSFCGGAGKKVAKGFQSVNEVLMRWVLLIMSLVPYGVFCLLAFLFAQLGFDTFYHLMHYGLAVVIVLLFQLLVVYVGFLMLFARLSPWTFFRKVYSAMLFAFSVSSSNASIPVVLNTVKTKLGVSNKVASFVVPIGATINMDGTAIMQGVATVFIANAYGVHLGIGGYLTVISMATLASVGTAGVPGIGLITLAMVLQQVGLPAAGIGLIIGIDRLLDMLRTAVNVAGDMMIACVVAKSEDSMDLQLYANLYDS